MSIRKIAKKLSVIMTLTIMCCSCSNEETSLPVIGADSLSENTPDKIIVSADESNSLENNDKTTETAIVDADVVLPESVKYAVYNVSNRTRTEQEAKEIKNQLLNDSDADYEILSYEDGITYYLWKNSDKWLSINGHDLGIGFTTSFSNYVFDRFSVPSPNGVTKPEFDRRELSFGSIQNAVDHVTEIINNLGISVAKNPEVFSISLPETSEAASVECYYIRFNIQFNDIPIYNELINYKTIPDYATFNPTVDAIWSADGLMYLDINNYMGNIEKAYDINELITAEAAAQTSLDKYNEVVTTSSIVFDKIELMYVYIPDKKDNVVKMCPAWICTGTNTEIVDLSERGGTGSKEQIRKITVIINALDGKEII